MILNKNIYIFLCLLLTCNTGAQTPKISYELDSRNTEMPGNYLVRDYVLIKQGYSFKAEAGKSMTAKIGIFPSLFQPNTLPGDTTSGANTGNPPAGGSYATQPDNDFSGLPMRIAAGSGQAGSSANRRNFLVPQLWFKTTPVSSNLNGLYRWYDVAAQKSQMNVINAQVKGKNSALVEIKLLLTILILP